MREKGSVNHKHLQSTRISELQTEVFEIVIIFHMAKELGQASPVPQFYNPKYWGSYIRDFESSRPVWAAKRFIKK